MKNLINEIMETRKGFTDKTRTVGLDQECIIDTVDICKNLARYQVTDFTFEEYDENDELIEKDFENVDDYLDYLVNMYDLKEAGCDNSYNWLAPVTNHFNYYVYKDSCNDKVYVEFKVHLHGDVRANYTEPVLLEFDNMEEFYEVIYECNKNVKYIINGQELNLDINVFCDGIEVYDDEGNYKMTVNEFSDEDILEELKEFFGEEEAGV